MARQSIKAIMKPSLSLAVACLLFVLVCDVFSAKTNPQQVHISSTGTKKASSKHSHFSAILKSYFVSTFFFFFFF